MSILNLNTPQGRGPVGKKSMKLWMGVGLLAAVLGFGSTLAANISINSPGGTSEFGQGVTQTIFCGADEASVIVTPASAYTNTTTWRSPNPNFTFITRFSSGEGETSVNPVTIYGSTSSISPKFASASPYPSAKVGWWLPSSSSTASPIPTQPTADQVADSPSGTYFFTDRNSNGTFKRPASPSPSPSSVAVRVSDELSNFKLGKVTISNIPAACSGVNFVLSSYGATGSAQTLSSSGSGITEVAVLWNQGKTATYPSKSRTVFSDTKLGSTYLVTSQQTSSSLTFTFATPNISARDLSKLVIETQEDAIGVGVGD